MTEAATSPENFRRLIEATMTEFVDLKLARQKTGAPQMHLCEIRFNKDDVDQYELANGEVEFATELIDQIGDVKVFGVPDVDPGVALINFDGKRWCFLSISETGVIVREP